MQNPDTSGAFALADVHANIIADLRWQGTFEQYCAKIIEYPKTVQTAHQRLYSAIAVHGQTEYTRYRERVIRHNVFDDPFTPNHENAIYGNNVDVALMKFVSTLRAAAQGLGQEHRMYLLRGPVGTAKSTTADLLSKALEHYTRTPEGQLFAPFWIVDEGDEMGMDILGTTSQKFDRTHRDCPLHEEPLAVLPKEIREPLIKDLEGRINRRLPEGASRMMLTVPTDPCPLCAFIFEKFLDREKGDWRKVVEKHLRVRRIILSEVDRRGIVIVRPKDQKDQDATEFVGEHNYKALADYGSSDDPRTFNFRGGHYFASNRGMFYWEEELKFSLSFLYDLLGASMEHKVQPRAFRQVHVDEVLIGSTNEHEFAKLKEKNEMEALRDRTISIQIPYILEVSNEEKIYKKFFTADRRDGQHLAPHTLRIASLWAVMTRLAEAKKADKMDKLTKARLYDGKQVRGYTEDSIKELLTETGEKEGTTEAISPRYIGDKISAAFMSADGKGCVNPFLVLRELKDGLSNHPHLNKGNKRAEYEELIELAKKDLTEALKEDIQAAIVGDENAVRELFERYIDHTQAAASNSKVKDSVTQEDVLPDIDFLRRIEDLIEVKDHEDFRQKLLNAMGARARQREKDPSVPPFDFKNDQLLFKGLRLFLFEQTKDQINWEMLISRKATDVGQQRRIDQIRDRLIEQRGYCDVCAPEVMTHVAGIFKRGDRVATS